MAQSKPKAKKQPQPKSKPKPSTKSKSKSKAESKPEVRAKPELRAKPEVRAKPRRRKPPQPPFARQVFEPSATAVRERRCRNDYPSGHLLVLLPPQEMIDSLDDDVALDDLINHPLYGAFFNVFMVYRTSFYKANKSHRYRISMYMMEYVRAGGVHHRKITDELRKKVMGSFADCCHETESNKLGDDATSKFLIPVKNDVYIQQRIHDLGVSLLVYLRRLDKIENEKMLAKDPKAKKRKAKTARKSTVSPKASTFKIRNTMASKSASKSAVVTATWKRETGSSSSTDNKSAAKELQQYYPHPFASTAQKQPPAPTTTTHTSLYQNPLNNVTNWQTMWKQLLEYRQAFGHANVPSGWAGNVALADWVTQQRQMFRETNGYRQPTFFERERKRKLLDIGFDWRYPQRKPKDDNKAADDRDGGCDNKDKNDEDAEHNHDTSGADFEYRERILSGGNLFLNDSLVPLLW